MTLESSLLRAEVIEERFAACLLRVLWGALTIFFTLTRARAAAPIPHRRFLFCFFALAEPAKTRLS